MMHDVSSRSRWIEYEENHGCHFLGGLFAGLGILGGGALGFLGSSQAAQAQLQAQQEALAFEKQVFGTEQRNLLPYLHGGTKAWEEVLRNIGTPSHPGILTESPARFGNVPYPTAQTFKESPGYQFQLHQGVQAIRDAGAGTGGALSGNMLKALQSYGTGLANQDWYNYLNEYWRRYGAAANQQQNLWNRLTGLGAAGQQAGTLTAPQAQLAGGIGNILQNQGATSAAGILGQFGSIGNVLNPSNMSSLFNLFAGGGAGGNFGGSGYGISMIPGTGVSVSSPTGQDFVSY